MKVEIRESFGIPPMAPFGIGEVLAVDDKLAQQWIASGRAIAVEDVMVIAAVAPAAAPRAATRETTIRRNRREQR